MYFTCALTILKGCIQKARVIFDRWWAYKRTYTIYFIYLNVYNFYFNKYVTCVTAKKMHVTIKENITVIFRFI